MHLQFITCKLCNQLRGNSSPSSRPESRLLADSHADSFHGMWKPTAGCGLKGRKAGEEIDEGNWKLINKDNYSCPPSSVWYIWMTRCKWSVSFPFRQQVGKRTRCPSSSQRFSRAWLPTRRRRFTSVMPSCPSTVTTCVRPRTTRLCRPWRKQAKKSSLRVREFSALNDL